MDVGFELGQQARHQVDRARELGDFLQVQGHPQVILGRVEPHPRHGVFARDIIGVIRLMLMPDESPGKPVPSFALHGRSEIERLIGAAIAPLRASDAGSS